MLRKMQKFQWTAEEQIVFNTLKEKLTAPVLTYLDFTQEFIVTTDISDYAVLLQEEIVNDQ